MGNNKQIQKISEYSIDRIKATSDLAMRGLQELGLLKDEKHFTIIYVCQFCGRLINYSLTPCIFCGNFPITKREVVIAQALSSESMKINWLLGVSKAVKDKEDLEIVIANLRQLIDDVLENEERHPLYEVAFSLMDHIANDESCNKNKQSEIIKRSKILCRECKQEISFADLPCAYCGVRAQQQGREAKTLKSELSVIEKWIVAINNFLLFIENYLDMGENEKAMDELIFVSVYIINNLIEKDDLPEVGLKKLWKDLLNEVHYFGSYAVKGAVEINQNKVDMEAEPDITPEGKFTIMSLGLNLSYLLKY